VSYSPQIEVSKINLSLQSEEIHPSLDYLLQELYQSFLLMARQIGFEVRPPWGAKNLSPAILVVGLFYFYETTRNFILLIPNSLY